MTERLRLFIATSMVVMLAVGLWYAISATRADPGDHTASEIESTIAAVDAWGSFAATGDIRLVSEWFAVDGPQYAQLVSEVDSILPGGVYDFALVDAVVVEPGLVRGFVTVTGETGEPQTYHWDIELVEQDNRWKVWTVRTSP